MEQILDLKLDHASLEKSSSCPKTSRLTAFEPLRELGRGCYSRVVLARHRESDELVALKAIRKNFEAEAQQNKLVMVEREALTMMNNSSFVTKMFESFQTETHYYFAMEFCPGGDVTAFTRKKRKLPECEARILAAQLVIALEELHSKDFVYRDLKPENVLIGADGFLRLADFGLSRKLGETRANTFCGTVEYMAPEIVGRNEYGKEVDWWALGCFIYELVTGLPPFFSTRRNAFEVYEKIKKHVPKFESCVSDSLKDLLEKLLKKSPNKRLGSKGAKSIKDHAWFCTVDWDALRSKQMPPPIDLSELTFVEASRDPNLVLESSGEAASGKVKRNPNFSIQLAQVFSTEVSETSPSPQKKEWTDGEKMFIGEVVFDF